jgi:hypothetical protein
MKFAVCVPLAHCDCYGHLTQYATQLAETAARRGIETEILRAKSPDFATRLFANLADEDCVVHFHSFLYDLRLETSLVAKMSMHALDHARAVTFATISDHPFTDFMQGMVRGAHPSTTFIVIEKSFVDEMRALNPALKRARFEYQPFGPPQNYDAAHVRAFERRDFDLVVPLRVIDLAGRSLEQLLSRLNIDWLAAATKATYHAALADLTRSPFHIFMDELCRVLGKLTFSDIRSHRPEAADGMMNLLSSIDGIVRQERRHRIVSALLRDIGDLKVAVLCDPVPGLAVDENVRFLGPLKTSETIPLMANARAILNCNPSYPSNLHERVAVGMLYGSCVISDVNTFMAETFTRGEFLPYDLGSGASLAQLFKTHDIEAIGAAASHRTRNDRAFTWDAHFDDLVRIAKATRAAPALAAAS